MSVDAKDGYVAIHGWKGVSAEPGVAFCQRLAEVGCKAIIYCDIACDGAMKAPASPSTLDLQRSARRGHHGQRRYFLGKELLELEGDGDCRRHPRQSLYTGALDLGRCVALVQEVRSRP